MTQSGNKKNPLILSQRFTSYMETHRIFQLFQELSTMLLIKQPDDHVMFLKQSLQHASRRLDVPRIIIIAPPDYDRCALAQRLQKKLELPLITLADISDFPQTVALETSKNSIENLRSILIRYMKVDIDGWIFVDFPRIDKEARALSSAGIIPTHVIEIISTELDSTEDQLQKQYYRELRGLRNVYSPYLMRIKIDNREFEDIIEQCLTLVRCRKYSRAPTVLRIALVDTIDAERGRELARYIAEIYNVIWINFCDVVDQVSLQESEMADRVRNLLDKNPVLAPEVKVDILQHYLSQSVAMKQGWVLTDLPCSVDEFKELDMTDYPPNRVIMIVDKLCIERDATPNPSTGSTDDSDVTVYCDCTGEDDKSVGGMIKYAGKTAELIPDTSDMKVMKETINYFLMQPPANVPPRRPRPPCTTSEDIEYDPDSAPSKDDLQEIRNPEPIYDLI